MDIWVIIGAIGSVASIVGIFLPYQTRNQRIMHATYGFAIAIFATVATWYWVENSRIKSVERAATILAAGAEMDYTHEGFVLASLAFLEKNKDLYPDTYGRAQKIVQKCQCELSSTSAQVVDLSYALKGLVKGIGTLEGRPH